MIAIIGANGSMGKRYQAVLKYLEKPYLCFDIKDERTNVLRACMDATSVILCTPTDTHFEWLDDLISCRVEKILCEKPVTKDLNELADIYSRAKLADIDLKMVNQYTYPLLAPGHDAGSIGDSYYDYFRHGSDGIYWDCMQIIGMANGEIRLSENSPIWRCTVNGVNLKFGRMDQAYIWFINRWLKGELKQSPEYVIDMHKKVYTLIHGGMVGDGKGPHRYSS